MKRYMRFPGSMPGMLWSVSSRCEFTFERLSGVAMSARRWPQLISSIPMKNVPSARSAYQNTRCSARSQVSVKRLHAISIATAVANSPMWSSATSIAHVTGAA